MSKPKKITSSSNKTTSTATPVDDRKLAHPHREDQPMSAVRPVATSEPESSAFGLTVMEGEAETSAAVNVAFDSPEGLGVGGVKTIDAAVMLRKRPVLEPEAVDSAVLKRSHAEVPESDEDEGDQSGDGFGFVMNDKSGRDDVPADEDEEGPKGGAVFETG
jgi:hypothetical protein